jgi:hypothetical protein
LRSSNVLLQIKYDWQRIEAPHLAKELVETIVGASNREID